MEVQLLSSPIRKICAWCGYVLAKKTECYTINEKPYHDGCVKCVTCMKLLTHVCYISHEQIYCMKHYFSSHAPSCGLCNNPIELTDYIRKSSIGGAVEYFHSKCLICCECQFSIQPHDTVFIINNDQSNSPSRLVMCQKHFCSYQLKHFNELGGERIPEDTCDPNGVQGLFKNLSEHIEVEAPATPVKLKNRTVFGKEQLEVLLKAFDQCPKPDKSQRNLLALITGLTPKNVRTWFQNYRCKLRRCGSQDRTPHRSIKTKSSRDHSRNRPKMPSRSASVIGDKVYHVKDSLESIDKAQSD